VVLLGVDGGGGASVDGDLRALRPAVATVAVERIGVVVALLAGLADVAVRSARALPALTSAEVLLSTALVVDAGGLLGAREEL